MHGISHSRNTSRLALASIQPAEDCKPGQKEGSLMIDVILGLVLVLGSLADGGSKPPAGGLPIPQVGAGVNNAD